MNVHLKERVEKILSEIQVSHHLDSELITDQRDSLKSLEESVDAFTKDLSPEDRERIYLEIFSSGPLESLLNNEQITEILVNGPTAIFFEKGGQWCQHTDQFLTQITFTNFFRRIQFESKMEVDQQHPFGNCRWNQFRVHLSLPPLVKDHPHITLRRHRISGWSLGDLIKNSWADSFAQSLLKELIDQKKNLLIIGPTGVGKTSVLSACLNEVGPLCRTIIIEDTDEIRLPNTISTKLLTREGQRNHLSSIAQEDLVKESLRMRPDRLILGEVRGREAKDLILALSSGHKGSLATLHASHPTEALSRLEILVQLGAPNWQTETIQQLIAMSWDYVIILDRVGGRRQLKEIVKICAREGKRYTFEPAWQASETFESADPRNMTSAEWL